MIASCIADGANCDSQWGTVGAAMDFFRFVSSFVNLRALQKCFRDFLGRTLNALESLTSSLTLRHLRIIEYRFLGNVQMLAAMRATAANMRNASRCQIKMFSSSMYLQMLAESLQSQN